MLVMSYASSKIIKYFSDFLVLFLNIPLFRRCWVKKPIAYLKTVKFDVFQNHDK